MLAFAGGIMGVLMMVPLRRALIVKEHGVLPYPEGTACADVLVAGERGGALAKTVFGGLGIGALWKSLSWIFQIFRTDVGPLDVAHQLLPQRDAERRHLAGIHGRRLRDRPADRRRDVRRRRAVVARAAAAAQHHGQLHDGAVPASAGERAADRPDVGRAAVERVYPLHRRRGGPRLRARSRWRGRSRRSSRRSATA